MTDETESTPIEDTNATDAASDATSDAASEAGFIESVFLLGLSAASATKDAVESLSKDLVERGKMSQKDAQKLAQDLARRADATTKGLQDRASESSRKATSVIGFATKDDISRLEGEIAEIKRLLLKGEPVGDSEPFIP